MTMRKCDKCGRVHPVRRDPACAHDSVSYCIPANMPHAIVSENTARKRLSAREAMARTKVQYRQTLDYLA
ncbi:hypothetical protein DFP89_103173 [Paracoccus lutimaris]|uniref:Uncharacterized protein n=1 Tax=Paracoccus lutimaris TaxID=1490030 RepID=A0A368Z5B3_9RHOB|nr:hypothetical protein DFP89_103173 [Paracoccus lutimaris]